MSKYHFCGILVKGYRTLGLHILAQQLLNSCSNMVDSTLQQLFYILGYITTG